MDLAASLDATSMRSLKSEVAKSLGVSRVWPASLTASLGAESFLREFGDILKERSVDLCTVHFRVLMLHAKIRRTT